MDKRSKGKCVVMMEKREEGRGIMGEEKINEWTKGDDGWWWWWWVGGNFSLADIIWFGCYEPLVEFGRWWVWKVLKVVRNTSYIGFEYECLSL